MQINPSPLCGGIAAIPSKSDAHRAIICALLSRSVCKISPIINSDDIMATVSAAEALGAKCTVNGDVLTVDSTDIIKSGERTRIDCHESGSTLRFMLATAAALGANADFDGSGRLPLRPITDFYELFPNHGAALSNDHLPTTLSGALACGEYKISGSVSSQFITGLLLALPILRGDSRITLTTALQSKPYVDLTLSVMRKFGVNAFEDERGYVIPGGQQYKCESYTVEGDWSQAAFFLAAGAIGGDIRMSGLRLDSVQGDKRIYDIIKQFGGNIYEDGEFIISQKGALSGIEVDASQIPDLVPIIAVLAANAKGTTRIYGAERLRYKESDRIKTVLAALSAFGIDTKERDDSMEITGKPLYCMDSDVDCANDHRIAMAFAVMAAYSDIENLGKLKGHKCVSKSYPDFFDDFAKLQKGVETDD